MGGRGREEGRAASVTGQGRRIIPELALRLARLPAAAADVAIPGQSDNVPVCLSARQRIKSTHR